MLALVPLVLAPRFLVTMLSLALLAVGIRTLIPFTDAAAVAFGEGSAQKRGSAGYGKLRVFGSAGFIVTALVLQSIPHFDKSPPWRFAVYMGTGAAVFCASLLILPSSGAARSARIRSPSGERRAIDPIFLLGLAIIALGRIAMAPITSFLSLYVVDDLKWNAVGALWALSACAEMPLMVIAVRIIRRTGPMGAIAIASGAVALRLAIYAVFPSPGGVVAGQLLHSLCYGLFQPAAVAFVALRVPPEQRSRGMAAFTSLGVGLPTFLGSSLGGVIVQAAGYRVLFASYTVFALASVALYIATRRRFSETLQS
jgi:PPP family 3-phenylpropionic acid transporter